MSGAETKNEVKLKYFGHAGNSSLQLPHATFSL